MIRLLPGDCRAVLATLPANSVHCVVTSPPYYGLRAYLPDGHADKHREIGSEPTPDAYLAEMVRVFREVRRVLRPDGTCWVNLGDLFVNKQLQMMPARTALALQADGWYLRSSIIWHKPNPMPESVTDRPTSAHEHVFLLAKAARYFYDASAIAEPSEASSLLRLGQDVEQQAGSLRANGGTKTNGPMRAVGGSTRACRNVWTIATAPYSNAHFATFPPALAERCIRAGTSERGCCAACGAPWGRETDVSYTNAGNGNNNMKRKAGGDYEAAMSSRPYEVRKLKNVATLGWAASCACDADVVPCRVLDPFAGAGTTLLVADRLQRDAIGVELNPAYTEMAMARCRDDAPLFASPPPASDDAYDRDMRDLFAEAAE